MSDGIGKNSVVRQTLGERLKAQGLVNETQLQVALKEQRRTRERLGKILISLGFVREEDLARILFEDLGVEFVTLRERRPDPELCERFSVEFMQSHLFVPLGQSADGIEVVMANPSDIFAADSIQQQIDHPVIVRGGLRNEVLDTIGKLAQSRRVEAESEVKSNVKSDGASEDKNDEATVLAVDRMIQTAVELGATDLHLEPEEKLVRVRYRVDGVLQPGENLPANMTRSVLTRFKILSGCDITESRIPQDGRITWEGPYGRVDLRVSILPCVQGETLVCRLLDHSGGTPRIDRLGMPEALKRSLLKMVQLPHGIFYVTGPTGSGKTTTLYSMLATLDPMERKICTVEDPVEYRLPLIRQCQIHAEVGLDFAAALRSLLRQDPDVILIGETRDLETAQISVRASLTGHFVLSTLHTTTAMGAVTRLADMGVEPFLISTTLAGVVGQRLVRKLCPDCSQPRPLLQAEISLFEQNGVEAPSQIQEPGACERCNERGYIGRTGVFDFLPINDPVREAIAAQVSASELRSVCHRNGYHTMLHHSLELIAAGITTTAEILRVIPESTADDAAIDMASVVEAVSDVR